MLMLSYFVLNYYAHSISQENRFTRCDTCTMVKNELQLTTDPENLSKLLEEHNRLQRYIYICKVVYHSSN